MNSKEILSALSNTTDSVCCELLKRRIKLDNETVRIDLEIKKAEYEYRTKLQEMAISALEKSDFKKLDYIKQLYDLDNKEFFIEPPTTITITTTTTTKPTNDESQSTVDENKSTVKKNIKSNNLKKRLRPKKNVWFTRHLISTDVYDDEICQTLYFGTCTDNSCKFKHEEHMHSIVKVNTTHFKDHLKNNKVDVYLKSIIIKSGEELKQLIDKFKMIKY